MASTEERLTTLEGRIRAFETWKAGHLANDTKARAKTDAAIAEIRAELARQAMALTDGTERAAAGAVRDAELAKDLTAAATRHAELATRVTALEAKAHTHAPPPPVEPPPPPPPVEPPPPPPPVEPPAGIIVPAGTTLPSAIGSAPAGSTLLLRGGFHRAGGTSTRDRITVKPYPGETPVLTWPDGTRNDGPYFKGQDVLVEGLKIVATAAGVPDDSNGSAMVESDGNSSSQLLAVRHTHRRCHYVGSPALTERQQMLYLRYSRTVIVEDCIFEANGADGFGVHNYPGLAGYGPANVIVRRCIFRGFGVSAAITSSWPITIEDNLFEDCRAAIQLRHEAAGSIIRNNRAVRVTTRVEGASLAAVNSWAA